MYDGRAGLVGAPSLLRDLHRGIGDIGALLPVGEHAVEEDLAAAELPRPVRGLRERCIGILADAKRLSEVRQARRPNSRYASIEQCRYELRQAEAMYHANRLPVINSTTRSVEEMSTLIIQILETRTKDRS